MDIDSSAALQDLAFYRFIIDSLPTAVVTVDSELKITSFNPLAEEITGYSAKEATGRYCYEILQGSLCDIDCPLKTALNRQNSVMRVETIIHDKDGEAIPVMNNTAVLLDDDGKLIGGVESFLDISHLKAFEREKANFISMIAHDMKSALVTIGGFASRLLRKQADLGEEKQKDYLEIIKKEGDRLESLVNDFLEFSRLQSGKLKLNFSATSLDRALLELFEAYQPRATQRGITLELFNAQVLPVIKADGDRLRRVFTNLLDNALKFSKETGKITIATQETAEDIQITFTDQGIGIHRQDMPYIFEPFHRGRMDGKIEGSGLGLAAVKIIIEGHGGRVLVESNPGKGSIFTVILPKH